MNNWKGIFTIRPAQRALKPQSRYATLDSSFLPARPATSSPIAMHLTLFVPDLHWPDVGHQDAYDFPGAEFLARVLAAAKRTQTTLVQTDSWESRLATLFGFTEARPHLAALRSLGEGQALAGRILCADPVNLGFIQQTLVLSTIPADTLSDQDTQALLESLDNEFAGEGRFVAPRSGDSGGACGWYFVAEGTTNDLPDLAACSRLAGRRIDADDTRELLGSAGLQWLNRIQMCLNQHPVNVDREEVGLPVINSLWPWGLGQRDTAPARIYSQAIGDSPMLKGLCLATDTPMERPRPFGTDTTNTLAVTLGLATAAQHNDLDAWQISMAQFITDWISPALAALTDQRHPLQSLSIISPGAHQETTWRLDAHDRGFRGNFLQRCFGIRPKVPALQTLLGS